MKFYIQKIFAAIPFGFTFLYYGAFAASFLFLFNKNKHELTFVTAGRGWILERICNEIKGCYKGDSVIHYSASSIPKASSYFFSQYRQFLTAAIRCPYVFLGDIHVFYTHYTPGVLSKKDLGRILNLTKKIFVMNSDDKTFLTSIGVDSNKIHVAILGVNEKLFVPNHKKGNEKKTVGFCLRYENWEEYSYRKNHDKIIDLIKALDAYEVILLGYRWKNFDRFKEIEKLSYFKYVETDYSNYQDYYNQMDIFVSVSRVEGGPMPLLEAMFCNVFPVVSNTGFAPDLIKHGENGLIFDTEASVDEIVELIREAVIASQEEGEIRSSVSHLTWNNFGNNIVNIIEGQN